MLRNMIYIMTIVNIFFQTVYMIFGTYTTLELGKFIYVFYIFRTEYMLISGFIAFIDVVIIVGLILKGIIDVNRTVNIYDIAMLILNIEYMVYYIKFLMKQ